MLAEEPDVAASTAAGRSIEVVNVLGGELVERRPKHMQRMITIGQLADYAGVTVKAVRHYHQRGLLAEPSRDSSGYRRYSAKHAIELVKIRTLAEAGVPLARIKELLAADSDRFAAAIAAIDRTLQERAEELQRTRERIARPGTAGSRAESGRSRTRPSPGSSRRRAARRHRPGTGSPRLPRSGWEVSEGRGASQAAMGCLRLT